MRTKLYAIRVDAYRIVAAEISDRTAAEFFLGGGTILLATVPDLTRLAQQCNRSVAILSSRDSVASTRLDSTLRPSASPTIVAHRAENPPGRTVPVTTVVGQSFV